MLRYRSMALFLFIARYGPRWLAYTLAWIAAEGAFRFNGRARSVACANSRQALGPRASPSRVQQVARGCFHAAAAYYADLARTPLMNPEEFVGKNLRTKGFQHIADAYRSRKGVIIATIHYGNPEYVSQSMSAWGYTFFALTEPLEPKQLADLYHRLRSSQGQTFMPVSRAAIKAAIRHLRRGGALCIAIDRDIQHSGEDVPFLGGVARIPTGAVDLGRHTGATIVPAVTRRVGLDRFILYVEPPLPLIRTDRPDDDRRLNTARLIQRFEKYLRRDPSQWFVLEEPVWPEPSCSSSPMRINDG